MKKKTDKHYVYHIKQIKKIGATQDLQTRVTDDQGFEVGEYDIVCQTNSLDYASDIEEALQEFYGYRKDTISYKNIKTNNMQVEKYSRSAIFEDGQLFLVQRNDTGNVGVNLGLKNIQELPNHTGGNGVIFRRFSGEEIKFEENELPSIYPLAVKSQFPESDFFFRFKKLENLKLASGDTSYIDGFASRGGTPNPALGNMLVNIDNDDVPVDLSASGINYYLPNDKIRLAREQNKCSDLEIEEHTSIDMDKLFLMQKSLQLKFPATKDIGNPAMPLAIIATKAQRNLHAFLDEAMEFMDAIGGINDGVGNGAWKYWKQSHNDAQHRTLADLSESDLKELHMEVVDMFHFFMNFALLVGMSGSDLYNMYVAKNKENFNRQKRGY